jgi:hypothetical protein
MFAKKALGAVLIRGRRSEAVKNRVKRNRHCDDDSMTEMV